MVPSSTLGGKESVVSQGPLHVSPDTGLPWLQGQILISVHVGNFSLVDQDEI